MAYEEVFDFIVIGGGPAGATAANDLASRGRKVALLDRSGRIKPCGGAIPPRLIRDFAIPQHLLKARVQLATMVSPKGKSVDMPIEGGFVGMVDRDEFDEWLRARAAESGAARFVGRYDRITRDGDGLPRVHFRPRSGDAPSQSLKARFVIGADGANSAVGRQEVRGAGRGRFVFAYHEVIAAPLDAATQSADSRCEIHYRGTLSPRLLRLDFPARRHDERGLGERLQGLLSEKLGSVSTRPRRSVEHRDAPPRGSANSG